MAPLDQNAPPPAAPSSADVPAAREIVLGPWRVDMGTRTATDGASVRRLSPRALRVLTMLVEAAGDVVSRRALLNSVWSDVTVGDESLTQAVAELRRVFGDKRGDATFIQTIPKSGYRLSVPASLQPGSDCAPADSEADEFNLEAYLLCLEATRILARGGGDAMQQSEALRYEAIRTAPTFALAHAQYAVSLTFAALHQNTRGGSLPLALHHAETALRLKGDLAFAHAAHGFLLGALGQNTGAAEAFARCFAIDDRDAEAHYLGVRTLFCAGDHMGARRLGERAAGLFSYDYRELFLAARSSSDDPARERRNLLACKNRIEESLVFDPDAPRAICVLAVVEALLGNTDAAHRHSAAMERNVGHLFYRAVTMCALGELDAATGALEDAVDAGYRDAQCIRAEPAFTLLRGEQRYRKLERTLLAA